MNYIYILIGIVIVAIYFFYKVGVGVKKEEARIKSQFVDADKTRVTKKKYMKRSNKRYSKPPKIHS
jgi:hypothetical protein